VNPITNDVGYEQKENTVVYYCGTTPAQRSVQAGAQEANSYHLQRNWFLDTLIPQPLPAISW